MKRIVLVAATIVATIPLAACTPFGASCWDPEDTFVSRAETDPTTGKASGELRRCGDDGRITAVYNQQVDDRDRHSAFAPSAKRKLYDSCQQEIDGVLYRTETDDADVAWVCVADGHVTGVA